MTGNLDNDIDYLVRRFGIKEVIGALCRQANKMAMPGIFNRLNKIYNWLDS